MDGVLNIKHLLTVVKTRALLLFLPLRLGIEVLNPRYGDFVRASFQMSATLGIVGGLPQKSFYFVGYQEDDDELFFLDPHADLRSALPHKTCYYRKETIAEYHTKTVRSIDLLKMDPSMLFGFFCQDADDVWQLIDDLRQANETASVLTIID